MSIEARLVWASHFADTSTCHIDRLVVRDAALMGDGRWMAAAKKLAEGGGEGSVSLDAAPWLQPAGQPQHPLPRSDFRLRVEPVAGRFYPRLAFSSLAQSPRDTRPVRVLVSEDAQLQVDANHPLQDPAAQLVLQTSALEPAPGLRLIELFDGPGLQVPPANPDMAYFAPPCVAREDEARDTTFYAQPRLTQHLDAACRAQIAELYGRFLQPGARVLDLMSSWVSHLPEKQEALFVAGLGMNEAELAANPRLNERVVKDLNARSGLPWGDAQFDLVICTASLEYLVQPLGVMREARRVLRPGGQCVVTFSDRWFPTKAIRVWADLHPFERQALVLSLFQQAGFTQLHTESLRGVARPDDDAHIAQRTFSDPLFAVWGTA